MLTRSLCEFEPLNDFMEDNQPKKYFQFVNVGNTKFRLTICYIVECTGVFKDSGGNLYL